MNKSENKTTNKTETPKKQNIETIANTTPRNALIYLNKAKPLISKLFKDIKLDKEDVDKKDIQIIINELLSINLNETIQLLCYLFCCENEEELNAKVDSKDLVLPIWQLWECEAIRNFFTVALALGKKKLAST